MAERVCAQARTAAGWLVRGGVGLRVANRDPNDVKCRLRAGALRVDVEAQASAQAWTEFDTTSSHQSQVYGPGVHEPRQIPQNVSAPGMLAAWIPAQDELFATNGSPTRGGSYVTVSVTGHGLRAAARRGLARTVAQAVLAVAPRGPNPG